MVAGVARGRRLVAPRLPGLDLRPTSDRVREAVFNMVEAHVGVEGARVADLFCGSGALGIEALSRGAASCRFVDVDRRALAAARANLEAVGLAGADASFTRSDAVAWAGRLPLDGIDIALADPPYAWDGWPALLAGLVGRAGVVVAESDRPIAGPGWDRIRERRHGGTVVTVLAAGERAS